MFWKVAWSPGSNHSLYEDLIPEVLMAVPVFLLMFPLAIPVSLLIGVHRWGLTCPWLNVASILECHHLPVGQAVAVSYDVSLLICGEVCFVSPLYFA